MNPFHEGLARVKDKKTSLYGYCDLNGELVIPFKYYRAYDFSEGLARVEFKDAANNYTQGFIDPTGKVAIQPDRWLKNNFSDMKSKQKMMTHFIIITRLATKFVTMVDIVLKKNMTSQRTPLFFVTPVPA